MHIENALYKYEIIIIIIKLNNSLPSTTSFTQSLKEVFDSERLIAKKK